MAVCSLPGRQSSKEEIVMFIRIQLYTAVSLIMLALCILFSTQACPRIHDAAGKLSLLRLSRNDAVVDALPPRFVDTERYLDHRVAICNDTSKQISLLRISPSCGCTIATLSKSVLNPGDTAEMAFRIDTLNRTGKQTFNVRFGCQEWDEWVCGVTVTILRSYQFSSQLVNFGRVRPSERQERELSAELVAKSEGEMPRLGRVITHTPQVNARLGDVEREVDETLGITKRRIPIIFTLIPTETQAKEAHEQLSRSMWVVNGTTTNWRLLGVCKEHLSGTRSVLSFSFPRLAGVRAHRESRCIDLMESPFAFAMSDQAARI
jgi:hypothetical protein